MTPTERNAKPRPTIRIDVALGEWFADTETLDAMTDQEIVEIAQEDLSAVLEDAKWTVVR